MLPAPSGIIWDRVALPGVRRHAPVADAVPVARARPAAAPVARRRLAVLAPPPAAAPAARPPVARLAPRPAVAPAARPPVARLAPRPAVAPAARPPVARLAPQPAVAPAARRRPAARLAPRRAVAPRDPGPEQQPPRHGPPAAGHWRLARAGSGRPVRAAVARAGSHGQWGAAPRARPAPVAGPPERWMAASPVSEAAFRAESRGRWTARPLGLPVTVAAHSARAHAGRHAPVPALRNPAAPEDGRGRQP